MEPYARKYPLFALCGLNCGLCPRFHTDGTSRCPGCGGEDFHLKHPACHVITCNRKHDSVEFCFQCGEYPCKRYSSPSPVDSFITYRNVLADFEKARRNMGTYRKELDTKVTILRELLDNYNDGRRKNFYCLAVNLMPLPQLKEIMKVLIRR